MPLELAFQPCSPFLVWGCLQPKCANLGPFQGTWGQFSAILWSSPPIKGSSLRKRGRSWHMPSIFLRWAILRGRAEFWAKNRLFSAQHCVDLGEHLLTFGWRLKSPLVKLGSWQGHVCVFRGGGGAQHLWPVLGDYDRVIHNVDWWMGEVPLLLLVACWHLDGEEGVVKSGKTPHNALFGSIHIPSPRG